MEETIRYCSWKSEIQVPTVRFPAWMEQEFREHGVTQDVKPVFHPILGCACKRRIETRVGNNIYFEKCVPVKSMPIVQIKRS